MTPLPRNFGSQKCGRCSGLRIIIGVALMISGSCSTGAPAGPASRPLPTSREPATLDYVVLGDSLATGRGSGVSFADLYAQAISDRLGVPVEVDNFASDGMTTDRLLGTLRSGESLRDAIAGAEIITISVGFDDVFDAFGAYADGTCGGKDGEACLRADVAAMRSNYAEILDEAQSLLESRPAIVRVTDDYNADGPSLDHGQEAVRAAVIDDYIQLINDVRCRIAAVRGIQCADIYRAFAGDGTSSPLEAGLLASDSEHPSEAGQHLVARTLLKLGLAPLG